MKTVLITGCNRGLGLGLVRHLLKCPNPPGKIIATCRNIQDAKDLRSIVENHKNVHLLQIDLSKFEQYPKFVEEVKNIVKDDGLNVLLNNAGSSTKFTRISLVKVEQMLETYTANTVAPIFLTKHLLPLLKKAAAQSSTEPLGIHRAAVINISSMLGSVELNTTGGLYPYRCSKAALNIATKSMSIEFEADGILAMCIHPGWVKTDLGGKNAPMEIDESVSAVVKLMYSLNEKHNGGLYQWDGKPLPW